MAVEVVNGKKRKKDRNMMGTHTNTHKHTQRHTHTSRHTTSPHPQLPQLEVDILKSQLASTCTPNHGHEAQFLRIFNQPLRMSQENPELLQPRQLPELPQPPQLLRDQR